MKEITSIISAYDKIDQGSTCAALVTVVRVEGSSYRRTGARMLVLDNGIWVGGISGGCLEGDALKRARFAISSAEASLITYDTTEDDAHQIGVGLGCNGIIDVLFTPLDYQNRNNPVEVLKSCLKENRRTHILITITELDGKWTNIKTGQTICYNKEEDLAIFRDTCLEKQLLGKINEQVANNKSAPLHFETAGGKKLSLFIEILLPGIHLILMGHQYDVYPLARLTREMGWRATLVSNPLKVKQEIIASVDRVYWHDRLTDMEIDNYTAILLMSHDYRTDKINLPKALATIAPYIGMLGPKVRAEKILKELEEEGNPVSPENKERIYAPAGLDIGALSPEEIALSLVAEIRAVFSGRNGGSLRLREATIHERD